jgi:predicted house-cleaning noncanonical NTP pyrophosphatase (MazG superfamily)
MAIEFTEEEERKLIAGLHFIFKGVCLLSDVNTEVFERTDYKNGLKKREVKEFLEKILKVSEASARIDDTYIYTEDETEAERREKIQDEIYEWIEENVFNEKLKTFLSINNKD